MDKVKFQMSDSYRQNIESASTRTEELKRKAADAVANVIIPILQKFCSVQSTTIKNELTAEIDESGNYTPEGIVTISAQLFDGVEKRVDVSVKVAGTELELPSDEEIKKLIDEVVAEEQPIQESKISVDLSSFSFKDDDTDFLKVYHVAVSDEPIGVIGKSELEKLELEEVLKQAVLDETSDWNTEIEFVGEYKAPEIPKNTAAEERIKVAAMKKDEDEKKKKKEEEKKKKKEEDKKKKAEQEDLTMKHKQADSLKQEEAKQSQIHMQEVRKIEDKTASEAISTLSKYGYSSVKVKSCKSVVSTDMNGDVNLDVSLTGPDGDYVFVLPVTISNGVPEMMGEAKMQEFLAKQVSSQRETEEAINKETAEKQVEVDEKVAYEKKAVEEALEESKKVVQFQVGDIVRFKSGKGQDTNYTDMNLKVFKVDGDDIFVGPDDMNPSNVEDQTIAQPAELEKVSSREAAQVAESITKTATTNPQIFNYHPILRVNRAILPESLIVGDIIDIDGRSYKVISESEDSLSKEKDSGSYATLELVQDVEKA